MKTGNAVSSTAVAAGLIFAIFIVTLSMVVGFGLFSQAPGTAAGQVNVTHGHPIIIGGSTTIQPVSELISRAYMSQNPGVSLIIEGGGSGAGIQNAASGEFDIGSASRALETGEKTSYPSLRTYQIGGSAIVVIASRDFPITSISFEELQLLYNEKSDDIRSQPDISDVGTVVQRSDDSGTAEVFAQWLFGSTLKNVHQSLNATDTSNEGKVSQIQANGNAGVLKAVKENPHAIGFVDFGFAEADTGVRILSISDKGSTRPLPQNMDTIHNAILYQLVLHDGTNHDYIDKLTRPLLYITNGTPTSDEQKYIAFSQSPESKKYFDEVGYFSISEITGSGNMTGSV